jgi:hypothetical protein
MSARFDHCAMTRRAVSAAPLVVLSGTALILGGLLLLSAP